LKCGHGQSREPSFGRHRFRPGERRRRRHRPASAQRAVRLRQPRMPSSSRPRTERCTGRPVRAGPPVKASASSSRSARTAPDSPSSTASSAAILPMAPYPTPGSSRPAMGPSTERRRWAAPTTTASRHAFRRHDFQDQQGRYRFPGVARLRQSRLGGTNSSRDELLQALL